MTAVELAVQDVAGVRIAQAVGVDRLELCTALSLGGLTPSVALVERAVASGVPVHVLVRPRAGGFDYDSNERALIVADARAAMAAGAAGVVVGGTVAGTAPGDARHGVGGWAVDEALLRAVLDVTDEVTFHRAFDALADPERALEQLAELGVRRVLTTGGGQRATDCLEVLARMQQLAGDGLEIMAGGGIGPENVTQVAATGVAAVHASAKRRVAPAGGLVLGSADTGEYETTDETLARGIVAALRGERAGGGGVAGGTA
ncbi:copper homeostasis protein CutC [Ruania albidiflava]|uniref:copper homeostasis protein CutC n=1 Tax=Ruania albidiflava TaxID=366586 RepID=UPI0023F2F0F7|nr:copper homeostasis protein CutC [Ruania albidiflava]